MHRGGITCASCTLVLWENARETLGIIGTWHRRFREHADLIMPVRTGADVLAAKNANKVGIVLSFQNASPFEDDLALVQVFHELGVRIVQLTYNIQNHIGASCYEPRDSGLTRYGKFVIREMNRVGMMIDCSHVGERTTLDTIEHSARPVAITHANPSFFHDHPRNKSNDVLRQLARRGGVLGLTPYPHLTGGDEMSLESWCEMAAKTVELMGIDHVGIGSDASRKWSDEFLNRWIRMGRWTHIPDYGAGSAEQSGWMNWPKFFETPADFPNLTEGLKNVGFLHADVAKIIGGNWLRVFTEGFVPATS
jgi:microsomal dipeptidase-like Zn-dependent dipeptidase